MPHEIILARGHPTGTICTNLYASAAFVPRGLKPISMYTHSDDPVRQGHRRQGQDIVRISHGQISDPTEAPLQEPREWRRCHPLQAIEHRDEDWELHEWDLKRLQRVDLVRFQQRLQGQAALLSFGLIFAGRGVFHPTLDLEHLRLDRLQLDVVLVYVDDGPEDEETDEADERGDRQPPGVSRARVR